VRQKKIK